MQIQCAKEREAESSQATKHREAHAHTPGVAQKDSSKTRVHVPVCARRHHHALCNPRASRPNHMGAHAHKTPHPHKHRRHTHEPGVAKRTATHAHSVRKREKKNSHANQTGRQHTNVPRVAQKDGPEARVHVPVCARGHHHALRNPRARHPHHIVARLLHQRPLRAVSKHQQEAQELRTGGPRRLCVVEDVQARTEKPLDL